MKGTTKEGIRSRLLKNAAHFWGQNNIHNIDPFVRLLMEALSTELYKAYNEIQTTESRILEKITRLLTPELYVSARPAHAIAHLRINEPGQVLDAHNQFYYQQRIATREEGILDAEYPVVFTPLGNMKLVDGDVRFLASGDNLFGFNDSRNKIFLAGSQRALPRQHLWIGLELNPAEMPEEVCCYLNFNMDAEDWIYSLLASAKWSVQELDLEVRGGLAFRREEDLSSEELVFADYEIMKLIENDIEVHYRRFFVTIDNLREIRRLGDPYAMPEQLRAAFPNLPNLASGKNIVWLQVAFPSYFTPELLDHLYVSVNAFPVVNRKLQHQYHNLRDINKIIPIIPDAHEHFLSVASLTDDQGREYHALPFRASGENGYYSVKYGGTERFDERDAQEYLSYLSELLRDEVASFAAYGKDFVKSIVSDLNKKIRLINQKAQTDYNRYREVPTYLMVEPIDDQPANMEVRYWVTNSTLANSIRAGNELLRLQTSLMISKSPVLLTHVSHGRDKLKSYDRLNAYKYTLTTRNRIVTYEDIKSFCRLYLGSKISDVQVRKGVGVGINGHQGILSTTDVVLTPAEGQGPVKDWELICVELKEQIMARSIHGNHYRVMIQ